MNECLALNSGGCVCTSRIRALIVASLDPFQRVELVFVCQRVKCKAL